MSLHWLDNADSWICPICGFETSSPAKYEGCKCPKCGFQDDKDKPESEDFDKEWEVEATIEIRTSFFCDTKEEAEKEAHEYLTELCQSLYPDCAANSYEIEDIYSYTEDSQD